MKFIRKMPLFIIGVILVSSCKNNIENIGKPEKFCIPDSLMKSIKYDTVKVSKIENEINLIGKVTFNDEKVVKIYPLVSGIALDVKVQLGDHVEKGQVLAIIKSSEVANAENDLNSAQSNLEIAKKNLSSTEAMYKGGMASEKEYVTSQKELLKAESELKRVNNVLSVYGSTANSECIVKAPISGYIVEKFINPGVQIRTDNSANLFTISDLKKVWVIANVFESDIANIKEGESVVVTTISYPDKKLIGTIDKVYNVLDPDNKTMKVRIQLDNEEILLKPEMFANVIVRQELNESMVSVPSKSIVFDRNKYWVVVFTDKCNLQVKPIEIYKSSTFNTYISSGVKVGEKVLTTNQLLIFNALNQ